MKLIQCPQCGASDVTECECEYCGSRFEPDPLEDYGPPFVPPPERAYADYSGASVCCMDNTTCFAGPAVTSVKFGDSGLTVREAFDKIKRRWSR